MGDYENPVLSLLDDANARQHRIRQRARWLVDRLSDGELKRFAPLIEDMIRATIETQDDLKALRKLEHEKRHARTAAERQDEAKRALERQDEEELTRLAQFL